MARQRAKREINLKRGLKSGANPKNPGPLYPQAEEEHRAQALGTLGLLDTPPEERFDRLSRLAREVMGAPATYISLIDRERQWFKSTCGMGDVTETPRAGTFCDYAIRRSRPTVVLDATQDPFFCKSPYVVDFPKVRFYVGVPLVVEGQRVGTLCALDFESRGEVSAQQMEAFEQLAAMAEKELVADSADQKPPFTEVEKRVVSVLSCQLCGVESLLEEWDPEIAVAVLNVFLEPMCETVARWGGTIDDLTNASVRAFFNGPQALNDSAVHAAACALEMQLCLPDVNRGLAERGLDPLACAVGVRTGMALVGNLGRSGLWKPTVVGDVTETAHQLAAIAGAGQVLVCEETLQALGEAAQVSGEVSLRLGEGGRSLSVFGLHGVGDLSLGGR